jgi:hypothetical protein
MSSVNGAELSNVEQRHGNPVDFVPGGLCDFRSWGLQMAPSTERYRAMAYSRCRHWPLGTVWHPGLSASRT